ncbi:MAG TPA: hypothetical protein VF177_21035 [Anaerolineae bacterium]
MISVLQSTATAPNDQFPPQPRQGRENNLSWLERVLAGEAEADHSQDRAYIVLLGGKSPVAFRLRVAQSQLRHDLAPSHWSHAVLLGQVEADLGRTTVYEISLEPNRGFGFPPPTNGVQEGQLQQYRNPRDYPNIALLHVTVPPEKQVDPEKSFRQQVMEALDRFKKQRAVLDALELTLQWLAYAWGTGHSDNPLLDGLGIPSAAMLEMVYGAVGFDLTPGLESRASCPEAIWQGAKWWHPYYSRENQAAGHGAYHIGQRL